MILVVGRRRRFIRFSLELFSCYRVLCTCLCQETGCIVMSGHTKQVVHVHGDENIALKHGGVLKVSCILDMFWYRMIWLFEQAIFRRGSLVMWSLSQFLKCIWVSAKKVKIHFSFPMSPIKVPQFNIEEAIMYYRWSLDLTWAWL